jgi:hypothetical protein
VAGQPKVGMEPHEASVLQHAGDCARAMAMHGDRVQAEHDSKQGTKHHLAMEMMSTGM